MKMRITRTEDIGALLRGYRSDHGLNQTQLAERLHTSQRWVSHVENGKPTAHIGLVLRALNELGFVVSITSAKEAETLKQRDTKRRPKFSIDQIVDE